MNKEADYFYLTAKSSLISLKGKFDISKEEEHRQALILATDAVELALKALLMKRLEWTVDEAKKKIWHNPSRAFVYLPGAPDIVDQVRKFDSDSWDWEKRYPEQCNMAETTTRFPEDPVLVAEKIFTWVDAEYNK